MTKQWPPEYVRLTTTVVNVRARLRQVDWQRLDPQSARIIAWSVRALSAGLKAREHRSSRDGKELDSVTESIRLPQSTQRGRA